MFPEELHDPLASSLSVIGNFNPTDPHSRPPVKSRIERLRSAGQSAAETIRGGIQRSKSFENVSTPHLRIFVRHLQELAEEYKDLFLQFDLQSSGTALSQPDLLAKFTTVFQQTESVEKEFLELISNHLTIPPEDLSKYKSLLANIEELKVRIELKDKEISLQSENLMQLQQQTEAANNLQKEAAERLVVNQLELERTIEAYKSSTPELDRILKSLSQVGMRRAFATRARASLFTKIFWGLILAGALGAIYHNTSEVLSTAKAASIAATAAALSTKLPAVPLPNFDLYQILAHAALAFPLIWIAWFAARQYGFASKIQEDYDFKVATAHSYEAYKQETTDSDQILRENLLGAAFNTFSENPLRIYHIPGEPSTPLQEVAENISKMDKVLDVLNKWRSTPGK